MYAVFSFRSWTGYIMSDQIAGVYASRLRRFLRLRITKKPEDVRINTTGTAMATGLHELFLTTILSLYSPWRTKPAQKYGALHLCCCLIFCLAVLNAAAGGEPSSTIAR